MENLLNAISFFIIAMVPVVTALAVYKIVVGR